MIGWLLELATASMDSNQLAELLVDPPLQEAIGDMTSGNPGGLPFCEARLKHLRDQRSPIEAAEQKGREDSLAKGREDPRRASFGIVTHQLHRSTKHRQCCPT
ncbi:MAG: hypothetical protein Aurels2KO_45230 [Aureliella sp.]